jgi:hypothetical protein
MPRVVIDPYTQLANAIETALVAEFSDIAYLQFHHDRLHESLGADGITHVAVSPEMDTAERAGTLAHQVYIQFYGPFVAETNPHQEADPREITTKAERARQALQDIRTLGLPEMWFFDVMEIAYPNDATGNKTRFEMTIRAWGNDTGLVETTG